MTFEPGDIQWLNNYVILHSRTEFEDYDDAARRRLLLRLWLNHPGARPLAHDFANKALNGPRLSGQHDWYLVRQLQNFKSGIRGGDSKDAFGAQMRPMAALLADEQAMKDIAAYIATLK